MTESCDGIEFQTESPHCVICLKEIGGSKLEERSEWDWNEDCLFKVFEIEPRSLDSLESYQSLTYFCQDCTLRNQNLWELYSQIHILQKSLQEIKAALESDFKRSFQFEDAHGVTDRSGFLRYQLAKRLNILPAELSPQSQNFDIEDVCTSLQLSPEALEDSFGIQSVLEAATPPNPCPENVPAPCQCKNAVGKCNHKLNISIDYSQLTSDHTGNTNRLLTDPKVERRAGRKKPQKKGFKAMSQFLGNQQEMKLKDLRIKVCIIPPVLLSNPPINVHTIPGYIPTPTVKSARITGFSRLKIKRNLKTTSKSDTEAASVNDLDFKVEDCADEDDTEATVTQVRNSRKVSAKERVKDQKTGQEETVVTTNNQEMQAPEAEKSTEAQNSVKQSKKLGKRYPHIRRYGFPCPLPECAKIRGFNNKEQLQVHHMKVHEGISHPFKCKECEMSFRLTGQRTVHYKTVHLGEFTFRCEFCGKGFSGRANLQKHRVIHTGERRYKCLECPLDFKTENGRLFHVRYAHTGERPFVCDICGKGFVNVTKLKNHLKCVHHKDDRPIICHICGKGFPIHDYLYMHMRTHEKEAAAAAGIPLKNKPRWKRKPMPPTVKESLPIENNSFAVKELEEDGGDCVKEEINTIDSEVLILF